MEKFIRLTVVRLVAVALLVGAGFSEAEDKFSLQFDRVPIYELVRLVYGELLREPFIVGGEIANAAVFASVDLRGASAGEVRAVLLEVLAAEGIGVHLVGRVNVVERGVVRGEAPEVWVYRPRFRTVAYLEGGIAQFVGRGLVKPGSALGAVGGSGPGAAAARQGAVVGGTMPVGGGPGAAGAPMVGGSGRGVAAERDTLIYVGSPVEVAAVRALVESIDVRGAEIVVRASVFEVQTTKTDAGGVQIAVDLLGGALTAGVGSAGFPFVRLLKGGFDIAVSRLAADSRFNLVSSPSLRLTSGESARVVVGQDVPILGAVTIAGSNAPAVQSVSYQSSGVQLDLTAVALGELVRVTLKQELSDFAETVTGVNGTPTLSKRSLNSVVSMQSGEVVFLGGLESSDRSKAKNGVPFLPAVFGSWSEGERKTELVVMLQVDVI